MKEIAINYYRNIMITETKETQTLQNYINPMSNYKKIKNNGRKVQNEQLRSQLKSL